MLKRSFDDLKARINAKCKSYLMIKKDFYGESCKHYEGIRTGVLYYYIVIKLSTRSSIPTTYRM